MEINIYLQSKKIDADYDNAIKEYIKRTSPWCKIKVHALKSLDKLTLKKGAKVYLVTPGTNTPSSPSLAELINDIGIYGFSSIDFIISPENDKNHVTLTNLNADIFNLSSFSMDSVLTCVVLTEQLYRAYTILNNIVYHK